MPEVIVEALVSNVSSWIVNCRTSFNLVLFLRLTTVFAVPILVPFL